MQNDIGDFFSIGYYYLCYLLFEVYFSKSFGRIVYFELKHVLQTDFVIIEGVTPPIIPQN